MADEIGRPRVRSEGRLKVTGQARYAYEQPVTEPLHCFPFCSTISRGRVVKVHLDAARDVAGIIDIMTSANAPRLASPADSELRVLQSEDVWYRGQFVGAVIAATLETAREAAAMVVVDYDDHGCDVAMSGDRQDLYVPTHANPHYPAVTESGNVTSSLQESEITIDETYRTPIEYQQPMEPHSTIALWETREGVDHLLLYDSSQGVSVCQRKLAEVLGLSPEQVTVVAPHIGGGFGSKLYPHDHQVLVALAAKLVPGRAVKFARTREQMFSGVGYRSATIQRIQLGSDKRGQLSTIAHDAIVFTSKLKEFVEAAAVCSRTMYAAPNRRTSHLVAAIDLPVPSVMRAPGIAPGMFALESAIDELAVACEQDPIAIRLLNEPDADPTTGLPYSTRNVATCFRVGGEMFSWNTRVSTPCSRREGEWLIGLGVAAATYPMYSLPGSTARISWTDGKYLVELAAVDIGTGTWTALAQIAADALRVSLNLIVVDIGNSNLPYATQEGASSGISSWGSAIYDAAIIFREKYGVRPEDGDEAMGAMPENNNLEAFSMHSFGAQFAEVRVSNVSGEVRVSRMLGVFACGRIINPLAARSQLIGGMCMGISMALLEEGVLDRRYGNVVNHDLSSYHIAASRDIEQIEAVCIDEADWRFNPMGAKGVGEIGIVGAAAAVANATFNACGVRVRDLPITPEKCLIEL